MVTSQPLAARESRISSNEVYLPVPVNSRDCGTENLPIGERRFSAGSGRGVGLAAADEGDDFDGVPVGQHRGGVVGPRHDGVVALDGNAGRVEPEVGEQPGDGGAGGQVVRGGVDGDAGHRRLSGRETGRR